MQGSIRRSKMVKLKTWLSNMFRSDRIDVHDFVVNNPTFYSVQASTSQITSAMKALSKRVIDGAEYDSSARDPPPACHPGTRVQLLRKIDAWFYHKKREKALLWLSGPAGVGKSAVMQTFAESLAKSKSLGASLFFSRLNGRRDPQRVIVTLVLQLAARISTYRTYIAEKIALDPSLLKKGIKEQFQIFITEPFGSQGIGNGEGPWGILLDGLDECEGVDQQCEIIVHISEFVLNFPNAPLLWAIASRPEPHIVTTFTSEAVTSSHWSEYVPVDSTEGCRDVERYLNNSFKNMHRQFSHIPPTWPSETQFLKLANGASGLFVFASTAVRFMGDVNYADPVSRLKLLLSVIDHLDITATDEHPFALLDALYDEILSSIPSTLWPTTKRILGFFICSRPRRTYTDTDVGSGFDGRSYPLDSHSLMAASFILHIEEHIAYSSLHKLHSVLDIPRPGKAHTSGVSFFHASFGDYLTARSRSKTFFIGRGESVDDMVRGLCRICLQEPWKHKWAPYSSQLPRVIGWLRFYEPLKLDARIALYDAVTGNAKSARGRGPFKSAKDRSECLDVLGQIKVARYFLHLRGHAFVTWLLELWTSFPGELESRGLLKTIPLQELRVDHLKSQDIFTFSRGGRAGDGWLPFIRDLGEFKARIQFLQQQRPETTVIIFGSTPDKRSAFIHQKRVVIAETNYDHYYCFRYPY